jgi:SAM-dependent methyltransferase
MDSTGWDERYAASELVWSAEPNQFLVAEVDALTPGRALDLACGEGRNSLWLASKGWEVVGVDFSEVGLEKARTIADRRKLVVEWIHGDVTTYRPPTGSFDLVVIAYLHLPRARLEVTLANARDALAPSGVLVLVGHDTTNLTEGYGGPQDEGVLYGPDDVARALDSLIIDKAERVRRRVESADGPRDAIDVIVRAHRA